ncbi:hypothetical protein CERSUDRAFT_117849 [Gelatoporia subvermispora B]|uniref:Uncharacterized protein n=1 Tax=Ceriporiopsis subvermispora (strain B) TaxID=914234 RepID=M2R4B2_CERS8|nr:hypothetical protein CERSUDRAFT_117849 [Gelatoporia subvermispora B]
MLMSREPFSAAMEQTNDPPPSYSISDSDFGKLKDAFRTLNADHKDIQQLFKSVDTELEGTQHIEQGLKQEWEELRKKYNRVFRKLQRNASRCVTFLNGYTEILVPTSISPIPFTQKQFMLNKFLETIPVHEEEAEELEACFDDIVHEIEAFQLKVASALRGKDEPTGAWARFWNGVGELCVSIWNAVYKLLVMILKCFGSLLSHIKAVKLSCFAISFSIELREYSTLASTPGKSDQAIAAEVKQDCKLLAEKLDGFKGAWHLAWLNCSNLKTYVQMAQTADSTPAASALSDTSLAKAAMVLVPLTECLRSYSEGKDPQ